MSLRQMLVTGIVPGLALGTKEAEVKSLFGKPSDIALRKGRPIILRYGSLEVFLQHGAVVGFAVYFNDEHLTVPMPLVLDISLCPRMAEHEVLSELACVGIEYKPESRLTFEGQSAYSTSTGLTLVFAEGVLHSIQRHAKGV